MSSESSYFSNETNGTIASRITNQTLKLAKRYLPTDDPKTISALSDYSLVITGTISAGKSTICESLVYILHQLFPELEIVPFPEFLFTGNSELSEKMLKEKINGNVSSNTFQSYIIDSWKKIMSENGNKKGFRIFERCVDDCVICFCNIENKAKKLSDSQFMALYEELKDIDKSYDIPTYFEIADNQNESHFTKIYSTDLNYNLTNILSIIGCDISNDIKNRIIGLSIEPKTSRERIVKRSREGESGYTDEQLQMYSTHYEKLFDFIDKGKKISRFVDLGMLL